MVLTYEQLTSTPLHMFQVHKASDEEAFRTPIGSLSIRNLIVLGFFISISWFVWENAMPENAFDNVTGLGDISPATWAAIIGIAAPAAVGLILATAKTAFGTADTILINMIMVLARPPAQKPKQKRAAKASHSKVFGTPIVWRAGADITTSSPEIDGKKAEIITFTEVGEDRLRTLQIYDSSGWLASHKVVKVYQQDTLVEYGRRTSATGEIDIRLRTPAEACEQVISIRDYYTDEVFMETAVKWVRATSR